MTFANVLSLAPAMLDRLLPMHLVVGPGGDVRHLGPTLAKLIPGSAAGQALLDLFELRRPAGIASVADLARLPGSPVALALRGPARTPLRGIAVPMADGSLLLNLGFGIGVADAIQHHALTAADFAPTDLTVELLYLVEAKSAVMRESDRLNARLKDAKQAAESLALSDTLTGLGNRRAMDEALKRIIDRREPFGLMHLDLDYFKDVNDTLGHAAGDRVLTEVARVLRAATRAEDTVARVGGDEFVLIFRGVVDAGKLVDLGRRIIAELERPILFENRRCRISGSIGVTTTAHYDTPDADRMLSDADEALYASKRGGRATVTMFGSELRDSDGQDRARA